MRGYAKRMEHNHELLAWHAANMMNCWVKKKVTVDRLLGRKEDQAPQSLAELQEVMRANQARAEQSVEIDSGDEAIIFDDPDEPIRFADDHHLDDDDDGDTL